MSKVYIPLTTMQVYFTGGQGVDYYLFKVRDLESMIDGEKEATALLRRSHGGISDIDRKREVERDSIDPFWEEAKLRRGQRSLRHRV